jgi:hypothetical protein
MCPACSDPANINWKAAGARSVQSHYKIIFLRYPTSYTFTILCDFKLNKETGRRAIFYSELIRLAYKAFTLK